MLFLRCNNEFLCMETILKQNYDESYMFDLIHFLPLPALETSHLLGLRDCCKSLLLFTILLVCDLVPHCVWGVGGGAH